MTGEGRPWTFEADLVAGFPSTGELGGPIASLLGAGVKVELDPRFTVSLCRGRLGEESTLAPSVAVAELLLIGLHGKPLVFLEKNPRIDLWLLDDCEPDPDLDSDGGGPAGVDRCGPFVPAISDVRS